MKDVYQRKTGASLPDYIKGLSNPKRGKYYDSLVKLQPEVTPQTANSMLMVNLTVSDTIMMRSNSFLCFEDMSEGDSYNAWEEDLATLDIFFGQETVMGKPKYSNKHLQKIYGTDCSYMLKTNSLQSSRGVLGWDLSNLSPLSVESLVSALASVSCHSLRSLFHQFASHFFYAYIISDLESRLLMLR